MRRSFQMLFSLPTQWQSVRKGAEASPLRLSLKVAAWACVWAVAFVACRRVAELAKPDWVAVLVPSTAFGLAVYSNVEGRGWRRVLVASWLALATAVGVVVYRELIVWCAQYPNDVEAAWLFIPALALGGAPALLLLEFVSDRVEKVAPDHPVGRRARPAARHRPSSLT